GCVTLTRRTWIEQPWSFCPDPRRVARRGSGQKPSLEHEGVVGGAEEDLGVALPEPRREVDVLRGGVEVAEAALEHVVVAQRAGAGLGRCHGDELVEGPAADAERDGGELHADEREERETPEGGVVAGRLAERGDGVALVDNDVADGDVVAAGATEAGDVPVLDD